MKHWCEVVPRRLWLMQNLFQMQIGPSKAPTQRLRPTSRHGKLPQRVKNMLKMLPQRVKRFSTTPFFASTINVLGRMCLLKVLWLARVLTWGSEIAENVNEQLARMKCLALVKSFSQQSQFFAVEKIYCYQLWDCFANSSKYVFKLPFFLVVAHFATTAEFQFQGGPHKCHIFSFQNLVKLRKKSESAMTRTFRSTPVWCVLTCRCHQEHLYDQSLMACVGDPHSLPTVNNQKFSKNKKKITVLSGLEEYQPCYQTLTTNQNNQKKTLYAPIILYTVENTL